MKKLFIILLFVFSFTLSSCSMFPNYEKISIPGVNVIVSQETPLIIKLDNINEFKKFVYAFGPKADDNTGRVRSSGENDEALSFTVTGTLIYHEKLAKDGFTVKMGVHNGLHEAASLGLIILPDCVNTPQVISVDENGKFEYEIAFSLGPKFNYKNPGIFFDESDASDYNGQSYVSDRELKETLDNLHAYIFNYYEALLADGANRQTVINQNSKAVMPKFTVTFNATTIKE